MSQDKKNFLPILSSSCYNYYYVKVWMGPPSGRPHAVTYVGRRAAMIVLGIDPGVATIGFGVIRADRQKNTLLRYGVITTVSSRFPGTWRS